MSRSRRRYLPEFREQMVALVRSGRTPESLSREFEPSAQAIRNWVAQAEREILAIGEEDPRTVRWTVRPTNDWFARETDAVPNSSSHS